MIDVVPSRDLLQRLKCLLPAFGMLAGFCQLLGREFTNQGEVPVAQRQKSGKGLVGVVRFVSCRPRVLIEWLDRVVVESKRLPIAEPKSQIAIRQMNDDLPGAPLSRRNRLIDP